MSEPVRAILIGVLTLATSVWVGGYVAIAVVARVATSTLAPDQRVALFRSLGRVYGVLGDAALLVALGTGAALLSGHPWTGLLFATTVVAAALLLATAVGVWQARRMTRLRRESLRHPDDTALTARVRKRAVGAGVLRATIGLLSFALIGLGAALAV